MPSPALLPLQRPRRLAVLRTRKHQARHRLQSLEPGTPTVRSLPAPAQTGQGRVRGHLLGILQLLTLFGADFFERDAVGVDHLDHPVWGGTVVLSFMYIDHQHYTVTCWPSPCSSSRWRKRRIVLSSGRRVMPASRCANSQYSGCSARPLPWPDPNAQRTVAADECAASPLWQTAVVQSCPLAHAVRSVPTARSTESPNSSRPKIHACACAW